MDEREPNIAIQGLEAGYGARALCAPLTIEIGPGTGLGIIGANGSGKSTVLRTMFDLQVPVGGSAQYGGSPMDESSLAYRRELSVLVEDGTFFDVLSVAEHLDLVARGHGLEDPDGAVQQELEFFDLLPVADELPHQLSSGQRRKLVLAACLIRPSRYVILDEPEQRLDPNFRLRLAERLAGLRASGTGLVLVSHDALLIGSCTQQVLLLQDGDWQFPDVPEAVSWLGGA